MKKEDNESEIDLTPLFSFSTHKSLCTLIYRLLSHIPPKPDITYSETVSSSTSKLGEMTSPHEFA